MIFFDNLHTLLMSLHDYCLKLSALVPFYSSRATIVRARFFLASALLTKKYLYTRSDGRSILKKMIPSLLDVSIVVCTKMERFLRFVIRNT